MRKTPQRSCISCRQVFDKKDLLRIVRTPEGDVVVDPTGKMSGRGAYICSSPECINKQLSGKSRLASNLNAVISPEQTEAIRLKVEEYFKVSKGDMTGK
ncbi:MAG: YlxR family protein [Clostridiales bacterium]|nr:YlxR family protein [Clostridiales bacterium]